MTISNAFKFTDRTSRSFLHAELRNLERKGGTKTASECRKLVGYLGKISKHKFKVSYDGDIFILKSTNPNYKTVEVLPRLFTPTFKNTIERAIKTVEQQMDSLKQSTHKTKK